MMSINHKIIELSIAVISLSVMVLNLLFPYTVFANDTGRNNILSFDFSEKTKVLPFVLGKNSISLAEVIDTESEKEENYKIFTLPIEPMIEEDNDKIAENICKEAGIEDLPCWQDLKAMRQKESLDGKKMTGDGGRSRGWYHIRIKLHRISDECALDFKCSTGWTVKNLIINGYKINRVYAISRHNGGGRMAQIYARSVVYNSAKFEQ